MANFIITIPNAIIDDIVDAMSIGLGWTPTIEDEDGEPIPNPETKVQWAKRMVRDNIKRQYRKYKGQEAVDDIDPETARQTAIEAAEIATEDLTVE